MSPFSLRNTSYLNSSVGSISGEYEDMEENIEFLVQEKDKLNRSIHQLTIEHDILRRQVQSRDLIIKQRKSVLMEKLKETRQQLLKSQHLDIENRQVKSTFDNINAQVQALKLQLDKKYKELAEMTAKSLEIPPSSDPLLRRISMLQRSISLRKQHLNQVNNKVEKLNSQMEMLEQSERDLQASKESLAAKATLIEERRITQLHIIAEPIDSLEYEQALIREFDSDLQQLEARMNRMKDGEIEHPECFESEALISTNRKRRIVLNTKREALEKQRLLLESRNAEYEVVKAKKTHLVTEPVETENVQLYLNEISDKLEKRQVEVEAKEAEIDKLCEENSQIRKDIMDKWTEKTQSIKLLNQKLKEVETLAESIVETSEAIDNSKDALSSLQFQAGQIKRRIDNLKRDKTRNAEINSEINMLRKKAEQRQQASVDKDAELSQRSQALECEKESVSELGNHLKERDSVVLQMEENVKSYSGKIEEAFKSIKLEKNQLNDLLQKIPADQKDQFGFLFCED